MVSLRDVMSVVAFATWVRNSEIFSESSSRLSEVVVASMRAIACVVLSSKASRTALAVWWYWFSSRLQLWRRSRWASVNYFLKVVLVCCTASVFIHSRHASLYMPVLRTNR